MLDNKAVSPVAETLWQTMAIHCAVAARTQGVERDTARQAARDAYARFHIIRDCKQTPSNEG
jgi:hypothetical protein